MFPCHDYRIFNRVINFGKQDFIFKVNVKGMLLFRQLPGVKNGFNYEGVFLFGRSAQVVLVELEESLLFVAGIWGTDLDKFFVVKKFKYLVFPVRYSHEKLSHLAARLDLVYFRLVLECLHSLSVLVFF